jgi:REP element-mobilizing transposase RayT
MIKIAINNISNNYPSIVIDKYVIMPNHIHMIIFVSNNEDGRTLFAPTISRAIKHMKEYVTKQLGYSIWQKSYYDHIIRDEEDYNKIWKYIDENPQKWIYDCYYINM